MKPRRKRSHAHTHTTHADHAGFHRYLHAETPEEVSVPVLFYQRHRVFLRNQKRLRYVHTRRSLLSTVRRKRVLPFSFRRIYCAPVLPLSCAYRAHRLYLNHTQRACVQRRLRPVRHSHEERKKRLLPSSFRHVYIPEVIPESHAYRKHRAFRRNLLRHAGRHHQHRFNTYVPVPWRCAVVPAKTWIEKERPVQTIPVKKKKRWPLLLFAALLCLIPLVYFALQSEPEQIIADEGVPEFTEEEDPEKYLANADHEIVPLFQSLDELQEELSEELSQQEGDWALYLKRLDDGETIMINNHQMPSASLIKLFVAGRYEEAVMNHDIYPVEASDYWEEIMIRLSDNDAWVNLETYYGNNSYREGYMQTTAFAQKLGCTDSGRLIGAEHPWDDDADNLTSVRDIGYVLEEIYNGTYVNAEASARILSYMKDQYYRHKIPSGLPPEVLCANKTGELGYTQNDSAIIYGDKCTYILVIMSSDGPGDQEAFDEIGHLSEMIYTALNS